VDKFRPSQRRSAKPVSRVLTAQLVLCNAVMRGLTGYDLFNIYFSFVFVVKRRGVGCNTWFGYHRTDCA